MSNIANKTCDKCKRRYPLDTLTEKTRNVRSGRSTGGSIGRSGVRLSGHDYWRVQKYYVCSSGQRCSDPVGYAEQIRAKATHEAKQNKLDEKKREIIRKFVSPRGDLTPEFFLQKKVALAERKKAEQECISARQALRELEIEISRSWENHRVGFKDQLEGLFKDNLETISVSELAALYAIEIPGELYPALEAALRADEDAISKSVLDRIAESKVDFSAGSPALGVRTNLPSRTAMQFVKDNSRMSILSWKNYAKISICLLFIFVALAGLSPFAGGILILGWLGYSVFMVVARLRPSSGRITNMNQLLAACENFYAVETQEVDTIMSEKFETWISPYEEAFQLVTRLSVRKKDLLSASDAVLRLLVELESASRKERLSQI